MGRGEQLRRKSRHNFTRGTAGLFLWMVLASWTSPAVAQEHQHDGTPPMSQELEQRATRLFRLIRCPTCTFQTIEDSPSPAAHDLQLRINKGLQAGQTDDEIIEELVRQYGATILLEPGYSRATLSLWLGPILLFFLLVLWYKRKRK